MMLSGGPCLWFPVCMRVCVCFYTGVLYYILGMGWDFLDLFFFFSGVWVNYMSGWFFGFRY